jgi:ParB family chromosome partitioning protein
MKQKKNVRTIGLGSGLSSLLGAEVEKSPDNYKMIPVEFIKPGPWQPRKIFDKDELESLSNSIKNQGIIQPVILKPNDAKKNQYFIIAGERRWRACQLSKIHEIPAIIRADINDKKIAELSLVENIQRSELNPIEEAEGYQSLLSNYNYTQEDISKAVGKSRSYIGNIIRLLSLSDKAKEFLLQKKLTIGQVRPLIGHKDADTYLDIILKNSLNSRDIEKLIKNGKIKSHKNKVKNIDIINLEKELSELTGLGINIDFDSLKKTGTIKLECKNLSEFNYIIEKIKN